MNYFMFFRQNLIFINSVKYNKLIFHYYLKVKYDHLVGKLIDQNMKLESC